MGWYDRKVRRVRDLSCGDTRIFLELEVRRVDCRRCSQVKRERLAFLADNPLYTKRFAYFVGRHSHRHIPATCNACTRDRTCDSFFARIACTTPGLGVSTAVHTSSPATCQQRNSRSARARHPARVAQGDRRRDERSTQADDAHSQGRRSGPQPGVGRARLLDRQRNRDGRRALDHAGNARRGGAQAQDRHPHARRPVSSAIPDPRALAILHEWLKATGAEMSEARRRMTRISKGADLVLNQVSGAPGFWIGNVIVMAGVPSIMQAMLDEAAPKLKTGIRMLSESIRANARESDIGTQLDEIARANPGVAIISDIADANASP